MKHRYAPEGWRQGITRVRYIADDGTGLFGREGMFVGNSEPLPGVTPRGWLGVLIAFDGEEKPLDVDPGQLDVVSNTHPAFEVAERIAPVPATRDEACTEAWLQHYVALALAAHTAFHDALPILGSKPVPGSRPDLGYLIDIATAATATAVALSTPPDEVGTLLWDLTPESGALNGEYLDWLTQRADALGINPADLDHRLDAADFRSPSRLTRAA